MIPSFNTARHLRPTLWYNEQLPSFTTICHLGPKLTEPVRDYSFEQTSLLRPQSSRTKIIENDSVYHRINIGRKRQVPVIPNLTHFASVFLGFFVFVFYFILFFFLKHIFMTRTTIRRNMLWEWMFLEPLIFVSAFAGQGETFSKDLHWSLLE